MPRRRPKGLIVLQNNPYERFLERTRDKTSPSLYEILGVPKDASKTSIEQAYRELARETHPDKFPERNMHFKAIQRAFEVLSDPQRRADYDISGFSGNETDMEKAVFSLLKTIFEKVFNGLVENGQDPEEAEILKIMQKTLDSGKRALPEEIKKCEKALKKLAAMQKRLKAKNKSEKMHRVLREPVERLEGQIRGYKMELLVIKEVEKELSAWEYKHEQKQTTEFTILFSSDAIKVFKNWSG